MNHEYQDYQLALVSITDNALTAWDSLQRKVTDKNRLDFLSGSEIAAEWMAVVVAMEKVRPVIQDGWALVVKSHKSTKRQAVDKEKKQCGQKVKRL
jgi:hypothetical protein